MNHDPIRLLDPKRDLLHVADLIEICFSSTMDHDGHEYLRHIRRAAMDNRYIQWLPGAGEQVSYPLYGYVWIETGRIIGNLTLIPFLRKGKWIYLIANVAVHPDYRRRGIARKLTERALKHAQDQHVPSVWLQVRDDNPPAFNLYLSLGFKERCRRTSWQNNHSFSAQPEIPRDIQISPRTRRDWPKQECWLRQNYPPDVAWNLPINIPSYAPNLLRDFIQWLNGDLTQHWAAYYSGELIGTVTWQPGSHDIDNLWIGTNPDAEELAISSLLPFVRYNLPNRRYLAVNFPASRAVNAFESSNFSFLNTLVWMEIDCKF